MQDDFKGIDRRAVALWRWHGVILTLIISLPGLVGVAIAVGAGAPTFVLWPIAGVMVFVIVTQIAWYPSAAFSRWKFSVSPKDVKIQSGVVLQKQVHIPMDRVQHVDLERGPLERRFGLARLILFTAGTKAARQEIPGLDHDDANALRDQIARDLNHSRYES